MQISIEKRVKMPYACRLCKPRPDSLLYFIYVNMIETGAYVFIELNYQETQYIKIDDIIEWRFIFDHHV